MFGWFKKRSVVVDAVTADAVTINDVTIDSVIQDGKPDQATPAAQPLLPNVVEQLAVVDAATLPEGRYAMWFYSSDDPLFQHSATLQAIDRLYESMDGIETYVLAHLLGKLGLIEEGAARMQLPDTLFVLTLANPSVQTFKISLSQEKGLRLHFHEAVNSAERERVLADFTDYAASIRHAVISNHASLDEDAARQSIGWWRALKEAVSGMSENDPPLTIGQVFD